MKRLIYSIIIISLIRLLLYVCLFANIFCPVFRWNEIHEKINLFNYKYHFLTKIIGTRMHSSKMHTGQTLTVFWWRTPPQKNTPPTKYPPKKYPPQKIPPPRNIPPKNTPAKNTPPKKFQGTPPPQKYPPTKN